MRIRQWSWYLIWSIALAALVMLLFGDLTQPVY
jgi:hypothetical protein